MVQLCGESGIQPASGAEATQSCDSTEGLKVTSGWQRVIDEKWIIGLRVTNQHVWAVTDLYMLMLPLATGSTFKPPHSEGCIKFPSTHPHIRPGRLESETTAGQEPPSKRLRLESCTAKSAMNDSGGLSQFVLAPGQTADVVAMTTLPDFGEGSVACCQLAVEWVNSTASAGGGGGRNDDCSPLEHQSVCGQVSLRAGDVTAGILDVSLPQETEYSGEVLSTEDELALSAFQIQTPLRASSAYTQLTCLPSILCSRMGFHKMAAVDALQGGLCCTVGFLKRARIYFRRLGTKSAHLVVCTKHQRQLHLLFHTLTSLLPDDVQFSPHTPMEQMERALATGMSHIELELHQTHNLLLEAQASQKARTNLLQSRGATSPDDAEMGRDGTTENSQLDKLAGLRREFVQERAGGESCVLAKDKAERGRMLLLEVKQNVDSAMAVLTDKTTKCC